MFDYDVVENELEDWFEQEVSLRERLFTDDFHKTRDDVEQWLKLYNRIGKAPELAGAKLAELDLSHIDFAGANLTDADLRYTNLSQTNLQGANLFLADLQSANLSQANLQDALLFGADLQAADLSQANLRSVDLSGTDLQGANLREADLQNAALDEVDFDETTVLPDGTLWAPGVNLKHFVAPA
jgi:uncharacterized protein YjbI with pentapeptide repeats